MHNLEIAIAIVLSIGISYRLKINAGLLAIAFSYVVGVLLLGFKPADVIAMWPVTIFFQILAVTLFFSIAIENGTLEALSRRVLYRSRGLAWGLAVVFFLTAALVAALGAGFYAVMTFLAPAALLICWEVGIEPLLAGVGVIVGAQVGSNFMTSLNGVIFRGLFQKLKYTDNQANGYALAIFVTYFVMGLVVVSAMTLWFRARSRKAGAETHRENFHAERPAPLDRRQRITLVLIGIFLALALVPSILHVLWKKSALFATWAMDIDASFVAIVMAVVGLLLGLAQGGKVLERVPWGILLMIGGMGMLVQVAVKAGTITDIAHWMSGGHVPTLVVPILLALVAAVITAFSSYVGVTAPALFPIIPAIAASTHLNPGLLFVCATIGGLSMAVSPYSEGGSMVMSFAPDGDQEAMYRKELTIGLPVMGCAALVTSVLLTAVYH